MDDAVLLPEPARRVPLMAGSIGPRMLGLMLPHVDWWNTWYMWYGNTAEGFAELNARIDAAAEEAGREPGDIARSAAVLVELDAGAVKRPSDGETVPVVGRASCPRCCATSRRPGRTRRSSSCGRSPRRRFARSARCF